MYGNSHMYTHSGVYVSWRLTNLAKLSVDVSDVVGKEQVFSSDCSYFSESISEFGSQKATESFI